MNIYLDGHDFHYETENLCRAFFPNEKITLIYDKTIELEKPYLYTYINDEMSVAEVTLSIEDYEKKILKDISNKDDAELNLEQCVYNLLKEYTGLSQPWGLLTGIRPIKLFRNMKEEIGTEQAKKDFAENFFVSPSKIRLAEITEGYERKILELSGRESFSLYVAIPFCPTRCSYCSFVSQSVEQAKKLMEPYLELLHKEIAYTGEIVKSLGLRLETVYIGGGTPTTLSHTQLAELIEQIKNSFDMSSCREFTIEAGRPDTITEEKLKAMLSGGVDRISINPQTLNDNVLRAIGRKHSSSQTIESFELARKVGFDHINMDLIAGLPEETFENFKASIDRLIAMSPESITVHTLSMKRSSYLTGEGRMLYKRDAEICKSMVDYSIEALQNNGYHPYYLYRQSKMLGNLENTGWSKIHKDCLYNVYIMDETHTILACGAGAVSKLKSEDNYIERIFNFKYPYEYINRFEEMITRKGRIKDFYERFF